MGAFRDDHAPRAVCREGTPHPPNNGRQFSPTVRQGAFVGVDTSCVRPSSGSIFAVSVPLKASSSSGCFVTVTRSCSVRTIRSTLRCPFRLLKQDGSSAGSLGFFKRSEPAEAGPHPLLLTEPGADFLGARLGLSAHSGVTCAARTAKIHGKPPERRFPVTGQPLIAQKDTRRTPLGGGGSL